MALVPLGSVPWTWQEARRACTLDSIPLLSCAEALSLVADKIGTLALPTISESVALADAEARVLSQALLADRDQPPFPRSTRDGYAVRSSDTGEPMRLIGSIRAGEQWTGDALGVGQAIEIMTGAPVPVGADAVVEQQRVLAHIPDPPPPCSRVLPRNRAPVDTNCSFLRRQQPHH